jgi:hypothetical protein
MSIYECASLKTLTRKTQWDKNLAKEKSTTSIDTLPNAASLKTFLRKPSGTKPR